MQLGYACAWLLYLRHGGMKWKSRGGAADNKRCQSLRLVGWQRDGVLAGFHLHLFPMPRTFTLGHHGHIPKQCLVRNLRVRKSLGLR